MPKSHQPPIGINLTKKIVTRIAQLQAIMNLTSAENWNEATALIPIAYEEITSRYKANGKPGLIVVDEDNIWWIAKTELDFRKVLPRASKEAIAAINAMLNRYRPGEEAIIIRRSRDTMEPLLVQKGGHVESPGVLSNTPLVIKEAEQVKMPDNIVSQQGIAPNGAVCYNFSHKKLGELGRVIVNSFDAGHTRLDGELANSCLGSTPLARQKREMFEQIVQFLDQSLDASMKTSHPE